MVTHYLANYISILNHAVITKRYHCRALHTTIGERVTSMLLQQGYIAGYRIINMGSYSYIYIQLKVSNTFNPLKTIKLISKPTNRVFWTCQKLTKHCTRTHNLTQYLLSTPYGLLFSKDAIASHTGGEVLFSIN